MPGGSIPVGPAGALRWMARFDIGDDGFSIRTMWASIRTAGADREANVEPTRTWARLRSDSTRMGPACKPLGTADRGTRSPGVVTAMFACFLGVIEIASADPRTATVPDPVPRTSQPSVGPGQLRPSWDLDGLYLWLGPTAAASHVDGSWDSTFGGHVAVVRIREREALGVVGGMVGATLWTERGGGRIWADAVAGTRIGRMVGVSIGPIVELSEITHPRYGGSVGLWGFVGVTPFVRVGAVEHLGAFAEIGVHIALPVLHR